MPTDEITGTMRAGLSGLDAFRMKHRLSRHVQFASAQIVARTLGITNPRLWEQWEFVNENAITTESLYLSLKKIGAVL